MPPPRPLPQQIADVAVALVAGAARIWRAGAPPSDRRNLREPRCPPHRGTLLPAGELRGHLDLLALERLEDGEPASRADLEDEIAECRAALVGAQVIEIARWRAETFGRQTG